MFPLPGVLHSAGPGSAVFNLIKGFINLKNDMTVDIITIRKDVQCFFITELFPNIRVHYYPPLRFLPRSIGDPIIVKNMVEKYDFDLIHSHNPIALSKILSFKIPKILTLHGLFWNEKDYSNNLLVRLGLYDFYHIHMLKKILLNIDGFVAISPYVVEQLKDIGLYSSISRIFQINNPVDDSFFRIPLDRKTDKNIIFYPSVISSLKNQLASIYVVSLVRNNLTNLEFIMAGDISETKYFDRIRAEVEQRNLSTIVKYIGMVSREEMLKLYSQSSIVYLLSYQEVQPMVIIEAMATGTPIIASNIKCISYIIEDGVTGYLVDPNDYGKITEHTLHILSDKALCLSMRKNARDYAFKHFHSDFIAKQTINMYYEIIQSKCLPNNTL